MQNFDINDSQPNSDRPSERKNSEFPKKPTRNRKEGEGERRGAQLSTSGNWQLVGGGQGARGSTAGLCKMHFRLVSKSCSVGIFCKQLLFRLAFPFVHK